MTGLAELKRSIDLYVKEGVPLGHFLEAVVTNNLKETFGRADIESRSHVFDLVCYLYNDCPAACWGSRQNYYDWMQHVRADQD